MPTPEFIALVVFAVISSFTPGPNNTIATVTAANFGFRAAVPHIFGVPFGFAVMLALGAVGVAGLIVAHALIALLLKFAGIAYLLWLAWLLCDVRIGAATDSGVKSERQVARPMRFHESALFQFANPKAWMMAIAVVTTYTASAGGAVATRIAIICAVCALCAMASLLLWAGAGATLRGWLAGGATPGARMRLFNRVMGILLAATALWMVVAI